MKRVSAVLPRLSVIPVLSALMAVFLLSACAGGNPRRADLAIYDLGPAVPVQAGTTAPAGLALEIRLPSWLDADAMNYRLDYADPRRVRMYALARWAAAPKLLIQQHLRQQLGMRPAGGGCTLRIELDDFGQHFSSASSSRAVLRGDALLLGRAGNALVRRPLQVEIPAATADAAGGAAALAAATGQLAGILSVWLQEQDLNACTRAG